MYSVISSSSIPSIARTSPRKELGSDRDKIASTVLLKITLKEYFGLGVHTTDPLLTLAKWIAYATEVKFHFANIGDNVDIAFPQIGSVVTVATSLLLYDFVFKPSSILPGLALTCLTTCLVVFNYFQHVCTVAVMLLLTFPLPYFLACLIFDNIPGFEQFSVFTFSCWTMVLVAFFYVHNIWVEPSRQMLLGLQQVDIKI